MARFATNLEVVCIDDLANSGRGIWKILSPLVYQSDLLKETITVEPGFLTDYASVPRVPIAYWLFGDTAHKSAVIHDWLYHHHEVCDEKTANRVFSEAMQAEGIPVWRRYAMYLGVAIGGKSSWEDDGGQSGHSIKDGKIV